MGIAKIYRLLLRLYPRRFRDVFGAEMAAVFERAAQEPRGRVGYLLFALREMAGLMAGAAGAWLGVAFRNRPAVEPAAAVPAARGEVAELEQRIQKSIDLMVDAIAHHRFAEARFYSEVERRTRAELRRLGRSDRE